jgi:murein DD-endopeptidase MepM/ murein hydrolase activator NlpD
VTFPLHTITAILLAVSSSSLSALPDVKINQAANGEGETLFVQTTELLDATIGIQVTGTNIEVSAPMPYFVDTDGRTSFPLLTVHPKIKNRPANYSYNSIWMPGGQFGAPDAYEYSPPFEVGTSHNVIQGYLGEISHRECSEEQYAIDWEMPEGTIVCAARDGVVVALDYPPIERGTVTMRKGFPISIRHEDGTFAMYYSLQTNGVRVKIGDKVKVGQPIALSGNTGETGVPHIHFCVYRTRPVGFDVKKETLPVAIRGVGQEFTAPRGRCSPHLSPRSATASQTVPSVEPEPILSLQRIEKKGDTYLAVINGQSFAPGEEKRVKLGHKQVEIYCRETHETAVTISIAGNDQELKLNP